MTDGEKRAGTMVDLHMDKIREYVRERSRLSFAGHKKAVLRQRLETRLEALHLPDFASYWEYLQRVPAETGILLDLLTTNETFFFRNPEQFRYLREKILPALELKRGLEVVRSWGQERQASSASIMKLRILCAGCSTGEEPYSIAMTLLDGLRYPKAWDIRIVAGDLSESCLATARRGFYEAERLAGLPAPYREKYMNECAGGATVLDAVKELVTFVPLNLNDVMNGAPLTGEMNDWGGFDIVFCRNVMIYFSPACQQTLVDTLHRLLVPGGYLFTGDAEPLHLFAHEFAIVKEAGCLIYQKMEIPHNAEAV